MTARTAAEARGDLAEQLLPVAAHMACLVHGDGGASDIQQALAGLDSTQRDALIVVLAAMVDPDRPVGAALGWLDFNEHGAAAVAPVDDRDTIRTLAESVEPELDEHYVDPAAVDAYLHGQNVVVSKAEQLEAIRIGCALGMSYQDFDRLHGLKMNTTSTFVSRARKVYVDWGIEFRVGNSTNGVAVFSEDQVIEIRERAQAGGTNVEIALAYGVTGPAISRIVCGDAYPRYGGPIRPKRNSGPSNATREVWAHTSARPLELAEAS